MQTLQSYSTYINRQLLHMQLVQAIPTSSSGNAFLGHIFDPQYDGYLHDTKSEVIHMITRYRFTSTSCSDLMSKRVKTGFFWSDKKAGIDDLNDKLIINIIM